MFVWECLKSDGKHLGMCVDGFMFGSCCGHDNLVNSIATAVVGDQGVVGASEKEPPDGGGGGGMSSNLEDEVVVPFLTRTSTSTTTTERPTTTTTTVRSTTTTPPTTTTTTTRLPTTLHYINPASPPPTEPPNLFSNITYPHTLSSPGQCGIAPLSSRPASRIVGGNEAKYGQFPWQVSVRRTSFFGFSSTHRCGGALISDEWVATAGVSMTH